MQLLTPHASPVSPASYLQHYFAFTRVDEAVVQQPPKTQDAAIRADSAWGANSAASLDLDASVRWLRLRSAVQVLNEEIRRDFGALREDADAYVMGASLLHHGSQQMQPAVAALARVVNAIDDFGSLPVMRAEVSPQASESMADKMQKRAEDVTRFARAAVQCMASPALLANHPQRLAAASEGIRLRLCELASLAACVSEQAVKVLRATPLSLA